MWVVSSSGQPGPTSNSLFLQLLTRRVAPPHRVTDRTVGACPLRMLGRILLPQNGAPYGPERGEACQFQLRPAEGSSSLGKAGGQAAAQRAKVSPR